MTVGSGLTRRGALIGACLCCVPAAGRAATAPIVEAAPGLFLRAGLVEDATAANADAIANLGFVVGRDAVAVFDPGGSLEDGRRLRADIRARTALPIRHVILSHVHPDHVFGAGAFAEDAPDVIGHARLPALIETRGPYYRQTLERLLGPGAAGPIVVPTRLVADRLDLDLGGRVLTLTAHRPAHTQADLSALDRGSGVLLTGDLVFVDRAPSLDGDLKGWIAELAALRAAGVARVAPGHGPALVDLAAAVAPLERYLDTLLRDTRAAIAKGVAIEDAAEAVAQGERERWLLFDDYHPRNVIEAYKRLEWE